MNILLDQHLIELESHNRELIVMNAKLRKDNEAMREMLELIYLHANADRRCPVCDHDVWECEPSCDGNKLAEILGC